MNFAWTDSILVNLRAFICTVRFARFSFAQKVLQNFYVFILYNLDRMWSCTYISLSDIFSMSLQNQFHWNSIIFISLERLVGLTLNPKFSPAPLFLNRGRLVLPSFRNVIFHAYISWSHGLILGCMLSPHWCVWIAHGRRTINRGV